MHRSRRRPLGLSIGVIAAVVANLMLFGPAMASSSSTTLVNGASLDVSLDTPAAGTDYLVGDTVTASGTANVGTGTPDATIVYIVDQSGQHRLVGWGVRDRARVRADIRYRPERCRGGLGLDHERRAR